MAFLVRFWLDDVLPIGFPFLTFFPAVIFTAFLAGAVPGIAVALASLLGAWFFFIPPFDNFGLTGGAALALGFFAVISAVDIGLIHVMTRALAEVQEERERNARLAQSRETLFRELQHRISNNLQVVSSLIGLQKREVRDETARRVLEEAARRLELISRIHRQLHDPETSVVEMGAFLRELCDGVVRAAGGEARCHVESDGIALSPAQTTPLALITAELVANAIEHGLPAGQIGEVRISLQDNGSGTAVLTVRDDGAGLPPGFDLDASRSLGLLIVRQLATQISGQFSLASDGGAVARLVFPLAPA